jgi:hypothetical protein
MFEKTPPAQSDTSPARVVAGVAQRLRRGFDAWLEKPEASRSRVLKDCDIVPAGRLYPFAIPAPAYANLAFKNSAERAPAKKQMRKFMDLLIPIAA